MADGLAIDLGLELVKYIAGEIRAYRSRKELAKRLDSYVLDLNDAQVMADMEQAKMISKDPTHSAKSKEDVKQVYNRVLADLKSVKVDLSTYLDHDSGIFDKRGALKRMEGGTARLAVDMETFRKLVASLRMSSPADELELKGEFTFIAQGENGQSDSRRWLTLTTFLDEAWLSSPIAGIAAGKHVFVIECSSSYNSDKEKALVRTDIAVLNQRLAGQSNDATARDEGIPTAIGFREGDERKEFQLVTVVPSLTSASIKAVETLETLMCSDGVIPTLNQRVRFCANLAEAVLHVHRSGLVHKNIRPDNMLVVPDGVVAVDKNTNFLNGKLYLIGWQYARVTDGGRTAWRGEQDVKKRIYQHPQRQGQRAESQYLMAHDIYSLGVCMLEVLLWKKLLYEKENKVKIGDDFKEAFARLKAAGKLPQNSETDEEHMMDDKHQVKKVLLELVGFKIPQIAGAKMAAKITDCLNDEVAEGEETGSEPKDRDQQTAREMGADFVLGILYAILNLAGAL